MKKTPAEAYLEQARLLDQDAADRLLSRARSKLMRRLEDQKISPLEAMAFQLEFEDEDLNEWRQKMAEIQAAEAKKKSKSK